MKKLALVLIVMILGFVISIKQAEALPSRPEIAYAQTLLAEPITDFRSAYDFADFIWVGTIEEILDVDTSDLIPVTTFHANMGFVIKGDYAATQAVLRFYGGANEDGVLILGEGMSLPEVGSTVLVIADSQDGTFIADTPFSVTKIKETVWDIADQIDQWDPMYCLLQVLDYRTNTDWFEDTALASYDNEIIYFTDEFEFEDGDGGSGYNGTSFADAIPINIDTAYTFTVAAGVDYYFRMTLPTLNYVSFYSTGTTPMKVTVYDTYYQTISINNTYNTERKPEFTTSVNLFAFFYANLAQTHYFLVEGKYPSSAGSTTIQFVADNYFEGTFEQLTGVTDSVDANLGIQYSNASVYTTQLAAAIAEWNKLDTISITPYVSGTGCDIYVSDYTDANTNVVGRYIAYGSYGYIQFNRYYFDSVMTLDGERIKTILHEFGHALGMNEFTNYETALNVMYQGIYVQTKLGPADIAIYRLLWE